MDANKLNACPACSNKLVSMISCALSPLSLPLSASFSLGPCQAYEWQKSFASNNLGAGREENSVLFLFHRKNTFRQDKNVSELRILENVGRHFRLGSLK